MESLLDQNTFSNLFIVAVHYTHYQLHICIVASVDTTRAVHYKLSEQTENATADILIEDQQHSPLDTVTVGQERELQEELRGNYSLR